MTQFQPDEEHLITDLESLKIYYDPTRIRIMQELLNEPRTIHQVAAALHVPFTRLYYQFNLLEKHGFIRVVQTREFPGVVEEKYYQIAARSFPIDRTLLTLDANEDKGGLELIFSAVLDETRADCRRSVRAGVVNMSERSPHPDSLLMRRFVFRMSPAQATRFHEGFIRLLKEVQQADSTSDDPYYAIAIGVYPTVFTQTDDSQT
jgi:DNA-binding transcriptional ArsR family regulator